MSNPSSGQSPDIDVARRLADDLSQKLAEVQSGGPRLAELRAEVEALRTALGAAANVPAEEHAGIAHRVSNLESLYQHVAVELKADSLKAGEYIAEIGRILGAR